MIFFGSVSLLSFQWFLIVFSELILWEIWSLPCVGSVYTSSLTRPHTSLDQTLNFPGVFPACPWPPGHRKQQEQRQLSVEQKDLAGVFVKQVTGAQSCLRRSPRRCQDLVASKVTGAWRTLQCCAQNLPDFALTEELGFTRDRTRGFSFWLMHCIPERTKLLPIPLRSRSSYFIPTWGRFYCRRLSQRSL